MMFQRPSLPPSCYLLVGGVHVKHLGLMIGTEMVPETPVNLSN
jgi:hypothetical protein